MCASNETARRLKLTIMWCAWCCSAVQAGPVTVDIQGNPLPARALAASAGATRTPSIPEQLRSVEGHQLRCWQHGKLIIDEFRPGPASAAVSFATTTPDMAALAPLSPVTGLGKAAVVDGRNTTCLLKPQSRATAAHTPPAP
jgi:hypothetical protein